MAQRQARAGAIEKVDPVWTRIRGERRRDRASRGPSLRPSSTRTVLHHDSLEAAVVHRVAERLDSPEVSAEMIRRASADALESEPAIGAPLPRRHRRDGSTADPATNRFLEPCFIQGIPRDSDAPPCPLAVAQGPARIFAYYLQSRSVGGCSRPISIRL